MQAWVMWCVATEISSVFMVFRWMLYSMGQDGSVLYKLNGLAFTLVFFVIRVLPIPFAFLAFSLAPAGTDTSKLVGLGLPSSSIEWLVQICTFPISPTVLIPTALNLFWFFKLIKMIMRMGKPKKAHTE